MSTKKSASLAAAAALAFTLAACGGGEGGDSSDTTAMNTPAPTQTAMNGETEYQNTCGACHQANGEGMAGTFPPLAGSDIVNMASSDRHLAIILKGLQGPVTVKGVEYNSVMVAHESLLTDDQIASIATYERTSWGNTGSAVTTEEVAAARAKFASRTTAWTIAELEAATP